MEGPGRFGRVRAVDHTRADQGGQGRVDNSAAAINVMHCIVYAQVAKGHV
jgi:hypothetical protein